MPMQATTTAPLFAATLKPDRSARLTGGWLAFFTSAILASPLVVVVPEMLVPAGVAFVVGFGGLTALSVRQSRQRRVTQQVTLWQDQLEIVTIDGKGGRTLQRFDPQAVRLVLHRDANEKTQSMGLRNGADEIAIGAFLGPEDRSSFAQAFGTALRRARQAA
ncbi:DUF2244 domain-containing protein [Devosia sp. A369]